MDIKDITEGIVVGVLAAIVLIYGLRPREPYPQWMLVPYEQPWIFLIIGMVVIYTFIWSKTVGALLLLILAALYADMVVFGRPIKQTYGQIEVGPPFKTTLPSEKIMKPLFATNVNEGEFVPGRPTDDAVREGIPLNGLVKNYSLFAKISDEILQPGDGALF
jgi:hypothetical protein